MDLSTTPPDFNPFADPPATEAGPVSGSQQDTAVQRRTPDLVWPLVILLLAMVLICLLVRLNSLQARLRALRAETQQARLQAGDLQVKLFQLNKAQEKRDRFSAALQQAEGLWIVSAIYGSGTHFADVSGRVNELLRGTNTQFYAHPDSLGADPTPGWNKTLVIIYELHGQRHLFTTGEGGQVSSAALREVGTP